MIKCKKYKNIIELYNTQMDFKLAVDGDKADPKNGRSFKDYMDEYSDRPGIVEGVLGDCLPSPYLYKTSRHQYYMDKSIIITKE